MPAPPVPDPAFLEGGPIVADGANTSQFFDLRDELAFRKPIKIFVHGASLIQVFLRHGACRSRQVSGRVGDANKAVDRAVRFPESA
jgi:hypothetical protein